MYNEYYFKYFKLNYFCFWCRYLSNEPILMNLVLKILISKSIQIYGGLENFRKEKLAVMKGVDGIKNLQFNIVLKKMFRFFFVSDGDRKAYYENSQWTMQMNKDAIQKLRSKNKELRLDLAKKKAVRFLCFFLFFSSF